MLKPNHDRQDYGHLLSPKSGYSLDFAVGTTYSLDLDALVGACLSMGLGVETDSQLMQNPVCLLETLRTTGDKIALFCQGGQIHAPRQSTPLYLLLEQTVFPIHLPQWKGASAYPSFHAKFWLLRYRESAGLLRYRVVILSRNLTFDRSWDVVWSMDGAPSSTTSEKNQPLCDFLRFLLRHLPEGQTAKREGIWSLIEELPRVSFDIEENAFSDYDFLPTGIPRAQGGLYQIQKSDLFQKNYHELLILSPFLSSDVMRSFNERNRSSRIRKFRCVLFTRELSLRRLKQEDVSNFTLYTLRDGIIDGETALSEGSDPAQRQDIHAKVYLMRKYYDSCLYLGSLNATHNAVCNNVEFMICLHSRQRYLSLDKLLEDLHGKDGKSPFQEVQPPQEADAAEQDAADRLNDFIRAIDRSSPTAAVTAREDDRFQLTVRFPLFDCQGLSVDFGPLLSVQRKPFEQQLAFEGLSRLELSEFYSISVSDGAETVSRVLKIPTSGLPEDREQGLMAKVASEQGFYSYVSYLLGDNAILSAWENGAAKHKAAGTSGSIGQQGSILYEKMLRTAAEAPERFQDVAYLMDALEGDHAVPEDFQKLYETFQEVVNNRG